MTTSAFDVDGLYQRLLTVGIEKETVTEFFIVFSRFEFALKHASYAKNSRSYDGGKHVTPMWDGFASDIKGFYTRGGDLRLDQAVDFLREHPPRVEVLRQDQSLDFRDKIGFADEPDMAQIIMLIPAVRNNLFHGGKFPNGPVADPSRDRVLMRSCLVILGACLTWCHAAGSKGGKLWKVYHYFTSPLG